jgi:hypothetical protein
MSYNKLFARLHAPGDAGGRRFRFLAVALTAALAVPALGAGTAQASDKRGSTSDDVRGHQNCGNDVRHNALDRIYLPDGWAPEGITAGRDTTVFVGSLNGGGIWRGDVRTGTGTVLAPAVAGRVGVGLDYDKRANLLWVAGGGTGEIRVHSALTGEVLATYVVPGPVGFLNDVAVTPDAVYVTDSNVQQLIRIPLTTPGAIPPASAVQKLPLTGDLQFQDGFNTNGIVSLGHNTLVIVQTNTGLLFRVNATTGVTTRIPVTGGPLTGGDGLELKGNTLYVVRGSVATVDVVRLMHDAKTAEVVRSFTVTSLDVATTAALTRCGLWVVNARFNTPVTPTTKYWISRLHFNR